MKNHDNILELYLKLMPAQFFMVIASSLSGMINGLIIGNCLSGIAMVAMTLTQPFLNIITGISSIISGGAGILCGNYMGKGDAKKVNQVYTVSMITIAVSGAILTVLCYMFAGQIAVLLQANSETMDETIRYIRGVSLGILPMLILPCQMTFLQMSNKSNMSLFGTILLAVFSALFGMAAVRLTNSGIFGIGVSNSISRALVVLILGLYMLKHKELVCLERGSFDAKMLKDIVVYGAPAALAGILYSIRNIFINSTALDIGGTVAGNALSIQASCGGFYDAFQVGVGNTLTMLASVFVGERDSSSVKRVMKVAFVIGMICSVFKIVVSHLFGGQIAVLFGAAADVIPMARELLIFYAWSAPFNIITLCIVNIHQSMGRSRLSQAIYLVNCILVPLFCCFVLTKFMGVRAIWSCYALAEIATHILLYVVASAKKKAPAKNIDDMIFLGKDFDTENKYSISINNIDQVVEVASSIEKFCKGLGIDDRRAMLAGLCMEEMASNVVEHGFIKDNKDNSIDIFTCVENDEVSLRLRDNCVPFDPHNRLEMFNPEDPCKNIGIRMVSKIAKEMNYHVNFGMNIHTIKH